MDKEKIIEIHKSFSKMSIDLKLNVIFTIVNSDIIARLGDKGVEHIKQVIEEEIARNTKVEDKELKQQAEKALEKKGQTIYQQQPNESSEQFIDRVEVEVKLKRQKNICKCGHSIDFHYGEEHENNPCHYLAKPNGKICDCQAYEPKAKEDVRQI